MWYAIGKTGEQVRQYVFEQSMESALLQCQEGEIAVQVASVPTGHAHVAEDGVKEVEAVLPANHEWAPVIMLRNQKLDHHRWAWMPDSPLSEACKADWLAWAKTLHRVTVDFDSPEKVVWPAEPAISF